MLLCFLRVKRCDIASAFANALKFSTYHPKTIATGSSRVRRPEGVRVGAPVMAVSSNADVEIGISPEYVSFY
jgi:hypothetical protein